jgi:hypothetical protein
LTPRPLFAARAWIVLPAIVLTLADAALTLAAQPAAYWAGDYLLAQEYSPWAAVLLYIHPSAFGAFMIAWAGLAVLVGVLLNEPWNKVWILMIVMGHTTGTFSRLEELNYTPALIVFLAAALLTIFSWRRADALNTLTIRATQPLPEGEADSRS